MSEALAEGKAPAGLTKHAGQTKVKVDPAEAAMRASLQRQLQVASFQAQKAAAAAGTPRVFKVPALMLATYYDEAAGETSPQFKSAHGPDYFKKLLDGFGGNPRGSMTQFYFEASFGQFLVEVDVYGIYTSERSQGDPCYYGGIDGEGGSDTDPIGPTLGVGGGGALGMALEAVPQANADLGANWGNYDNDNDGRVDFTMIIHSGGDMAATGNPCYTWSHALQATLGQGENAENLAGLPAGTLSHSGIPTSTPGTFIDRVLTIPEYASDVDPLTIGVAAHEMAHSIGEPDYYDTSYGSNGLGDFDIMAGGSYLGSPSGSNPTMFNPASRVFQGWLTPTIVRKDLKNYKIKARTALPKPGYHVGQPDPNLLLVPTYEIKLGQTDNLGHTWGEDDVYGLAYDKVKKTYIVEGYYIENVSRHATSPKLSAKNPMGSMFDRRSHGSGLMVWHFDYWRQSTTYFAHSNDAQNDSQRYQMDVEEFDRNDNTQELQLNLSRGNPADYLVGAATGITSGTRMLPPHSPKVTGDSQKPIDISGVTVGPVAGEASFTVDNNPNNLTMKVSVGDDLAGDCKLQLTDPNGVVGDEVDSGGPAAAETVTVKNPKPGTWKATVADFAGCTQWSGRVLFEGATAFITSGAADTWSNWSKQPTGWAFTNVSGYGNGIDMSNEAGGTDTVKLDVLNLSGAKDVSPGFVTGKTNRTGAVTGIRVGPPHRLQVPIFSNGGKAPGKVLVAIHEGSAKGRIVAKKVVKLGAYQRKNVKFRYAPKKEGPFTLVAVVDPANKIKEKSERNQVQAATMWAGPRKPKVLIVDDDQVLAHEQAIAGALARLGVPYSIAANHPSAKLMSKYSAVIWEAAVDRYEGQLDASDRAALRTYLNSGGKLLMTSNRIFDAVGLTTEEGVEFAAHYLGSRIPEGNATYVVTQPNPATVTGSGILAKQKFKITPPAARPFIGVAGLTQAGPGPLGTTLKPLGTAKGIAQVDKATLVGVQPESDPAYSGIAVTGDKAHKHFKTVTLGWNLGDNVNAKDTIKVVKTALKFFKVKMNRYQVKSAQPIIYSNAVRDQISGRSTTVTAIVLGGKGTPTVRLYYRRHGLGKFYSVKMKRSAGGAYTATIPGKAFTPEGVDYYIKAGKTIDPFGTSKAPLYHGIAVSLPEISKPLKIKR
ncbi:immune inhibitor A domain-containing protein [Nocardioides sp.]|uniref:immune inhibitor A domain-containing protein n=1 Tax=Nocardioides sp. TaxID=35761 RepID=UPI003565590A